jgi:preprotein translocase subunit SecE
MSRAIRRHPTSQKAGRQRTPRTPAVSTGPSRRPQRESREGRGIAGVLRPRWAEDIISELRKVTWPTREEAWYLTVVVIIVATVVGIFLGGVDMFFNWFMEHTILD